MKLNKPEILFPGRAVAAKCTECNGIATIMKYPSSNLITKKSALFVMLITNILIIGLTFLIKAL